MKQGFLRFLKIVDWKFITMAIAIILIIFSLPIVILTEKETIIHNGKPELVAFSFLRYFLKKKK
ncbi:hypothetical protein [Spiroplasma endosymbiont of Nephrotoma flavescens]|uniref:hypothetical protein n=1 Tax=Spiroplasma endosymbiont of Nephrotoma flavescens TaxID=3066302 RepID=UPI00313E4061